MNIVKNKKTSPPIFECINGEWWTIIYCYLFAPTSEKTHDGHSYPAQSKSNLKDTMEPLQCKCSAVSTRSQALQSNSILGTWKIKEVHLGTKSIYKHAGVKLYMYTRHSCCLPMWRHCQLSQLHRSQGPTNLQRKTHLNYGECKLSTCLWKLWGAILKNYGIFGI